MPFQILAWNRWGWVWRWRMPDLTDAPHHAALLTHALVKTHTHPKEILPLNAVETDF